MEAELTGALKKTSNTDNSVVAEEVNVDEVVTAKSKSGNKVVIDIKDKKKPKLMNRQWKLILRVLTQFKR